MHTADWWWDLQVQPHNPCLSKQSPTETRRHFRQVRHLFPSYGCLIRRISQTSEATRKHGLSISRLEIFPPAGAIAPHPWQFCFLHYCPFPQNYQSPPKQINTRDKSTLTPYGTYSKSSLRLYKIRRMTAYQLTARMGRFGGAFQSWLRGLRTTWKTLRCME